MSLFQPPPPTAYDLVFRIFGISVRVHPFFWLIALLFGFRSGSVSGISAWIVTLFISILIHELGHSMAMRYFGQDSRIVLHGFGGLAIPIESFGNNSVGPRTPWHQIIISIAGPFAGLLLASIIAVGVEAIGGIIYYEWIFFEMFPLPAAYLPPPYENARVLVNSFLWVNIFWGLINVMPVFPLDGGRISRELFILFGRRNQILNSLWLSILTGAALAIIGITLFDSFYMAFLFGYLAFQSYQATQQI